MRIVLIASAAAMLLGCGKSDKTANEAAAEPVKKKVAHCFFKDSETKGWAASRGKDGNIKVKGKAYRSDSRYQAVLGPPEVAGTTASIAPTITQNMTGFGAEDDWWDVIMGTGFRGTVEELDPTGAAHVRRLNLAAMRDTRSIDVSAVYAAARKR